MYLRQTYTTTHKTKAKFKVEITITWKTQLIIPNWTVQKMPVSLAWQLLA